MVGIIKKYRALSFEEKTILATKISLVFNAILAVCKIILGFFTTIFFIVAGCINLFILLAKLECYLGIKNKKHTFDYRNKMVAMFLIFAGFEYIIYMARLIFWNGDVFDYTMYLGIIIAMVSFVELGLAISGLFKAFGKGHYYRNIKIINLCSALTAMILTEIAIMTFASEGDNSRLFGITGICVGFIILLLATLIIYSPKLSLVDREHNVYILKDNNEPSLADGDLSITLISSFWYGDYIYKGKCENNRVDGHIIKIKNKMGTLNIFIKIVLIVLSEILIFVYAIGAVIYFFKSSTIIKKLDAIMESKNYSKIELID